MQLKSRIIAVGICFVFTIGIFCGCEKQEKPQKSSIQPSPVNSKKKQAAAGNMLLYAAVGSSVISSVPVAKNRASIPASIIALPKRVNITYFIAE